MYNDLIFANYLDALAQNINQQQQQNQMNIQSANIAAPVASILGGSSANSSSIKELIGDMDLSGGSSNESKLM